jgi:ribosomal protein S18 acetylase RimI-like enzyme
MGYWQKWGTEFLCAWKEDRLIGFAKETGVEIINLEVRCDNSRAIQLYEKYGFRCLGTSPAFFKIGDKYIDFELMYLDLR